MRGPERSPAPAGAPRRRLPVIAALALALLLLLALLSAIALSGGGGPRHRALVGREEAVELLNGVPQAGPRLGKEGAPATVGLFIDLQCKTCASYALRTIPRLVDDLVHDGKGRLVFHHFSVGAHDVNLAAVAAQAAGEQGRLWQYAYLFFANIDQAPSQGVNGGFLRRIAEAVPGLEVQRWERDRQSEAVEAQVRADDRLAADLRLPAGPAVTVSAGAASRRLPGSPSAARVERELRALGATR